MENFFKDYAIDIFKYSIFPRPAENYVKDYDIDILTTHNTRLGNKIHDSDKYQALLKATEYERDRLKDILFEQTTSPT